MLIDIIFHDARVICMSRIVHIEFIIYMTWYMHETTHRMQGDIAQNGCECMVIINIAFGV